MKLWPDEFDSMRPEALAAAEVAYDALAVEPSDDADSKTDPLDNLAAARTGAGSLFPYRSDRAVDRPIAGVACRIIGAGSDPSAVYLHFHGGGMSLASPELNDDENERLADELGLTVVSVDYRLAPEHPYPAAIDDSVAVARWLIEHSAAEFGTDVLLIGGESSGAYLAVMVLLALRDAGHDTSPFRSANLVFGVFDWGRSPSQRGFRPHDGPDWLAPEAMTEFADFYLPGLDDDQRRNGSVSPAFADLRGLPPALFTVGTLDHMFDDTILTASRWSAAGNVTELAVYPDCGHGFHWFTETELSRRAVARIHEFLGRHARIQARPPN
jgi:acetyl esterase